LIIERQEGRLNLRLVSGLSDGASKSFIDKLAGRRRPISFFINLE
jgi:hypothetical protein